jgi:nucleoside-triphosphatase THEP1
MTMTADLIACAIERMRRNPQSNWMLTGPVNSGKSSAVSRIVERARHLDPPWRVGGVVSSGVFTDGAKLAYMGQDCLGGPAFLLAVRTPLDAVTRDRLQRSGVPAPSTCGQPVGQWLVLDDGLALAQQAIQRAIHTRCDLIVLDEFGPLESAGRGLRPAADAAMNSGIPTLLVVREALVAEVQRLYGPFEILRSDELIHRLPRHR